MKHSESIAQIAAALAKAQGQMGPLTKDKEGQIGRSTTKYADLASMINVMRIPFAENGLAYTQSVASSISDGVTSLTVTTMLIHESGEWMSSDITGDAEPATGYVSALQQAGRAITYLRKYALQSVAGIAAENDDDGATTRETTRETERVERPKPAPHELVEPLRALAAENRGKVRAALGIDGEATLNDVLQAFDGLEDEKKRVIRGLIATLTAKPESAAPPAGDEDPSTVRPEFDENGNAARDFADGDPHGS